MSSFTFAEPVPLAQVGLGGWGRNLLRNFAALPNADVLWACDAQETVRAEVAQRYPHIPTTGRFEEVIEDERVEAIVIATAAPQHFPLAEAALRAGKHVYVEKPLAQTADQAERLIAIAAERDLRLMVGHLLPYHPAFRYVERLVRAGELGDVRYLYSVRAGPGVVQQRENVFERLAPHDLAAALALVQAPPVAVAAQGQAYLQPGVEDVVFATIHFADGALAHLHTSRIEPRKVRQTTVVGSRRMAAVDDMAPSEKVRVYEKDDEGAEGAFTGFAEALSARSGDIVIPRIEATEPLRLACEEFVACIREGRAPRTDGRSGLAVARLIEAARRSLEAGGARVAL